jgi:hypothetical protein
MANSYCPHYEGMDRVCEKCVSQHINRELNPFEKFVNERWDYLNSQAEASYQKIVQMEEKKNKSNYLYLTLSPDKFIRNLLPDKANVDALHDWAQKWFKWGLKRWYKGYVFTIEGGSQHDHLHLHCVMEMKSSHKHAEILKRSWARTFPNNQLLTTLNLSSKPLNAKRGEYAYLRFDDKDILKDKLDYFINAKKGELHSNQIDLGLVGSGGSLTYMMGS